MPKSKWGIAPEVKRGSIVEAAGVLFTSQGYEATSMAAVAARANVAPNTIYWYFANKDALLVAVLDQLLIDVKGQYLHLVDRPFDDRINWLIDRFAQFSDLIAVIHGRLKISEEIRAWHDDFHQRANSYFAERLLARGIDAAQARAIVAIGCFILEGLATHEVAGDSRTIAVRMLVDAINSAAAQGQRTPVAQDMD